MALDGRKKYYSTSEVVALLGVQDYVLRHWENEFSQLRPRKTRSGQRRYVAYDIDLLKKIKYLMHEEKFTTEGAKERLNSMKDMTVERYKSISALVYDQSFWDELETIAQLL